MHAFQKICYLCWKHFPYCDSEEFQVYDNESIHILKDHYQDENTARKME